MGSLAKIKVAIIGAGSSYTPEIVEGLVQAREKLPVGEIVLMDIDVERLATLTSFCQRFIRHLGCEDIRLTRESAIREAIQDARFIVTQLRVGANQQRILDEKIPLKYGLIGQETTGPGGMSKAFRTIPVMMALAKEIERINPTEFIEFNIDQSARDWGLVRLP